MRCVTDVRQIVIRGHENFLHDEVVAGLCGRGTELLLEVMNARGQVLLGTSPVVEISLTLALEDAMRLIIDVDDESLTRAAALTGMDDHVALIRRAIELLVRIESGRQLGALGGSDPVAEAAPRSRERA